jgi:hypothetical protein
MESNNGPQLKVGYGKQLGLYRGKDLFSFYWIDKLSKWYDFISD